MEQENKNQQEDLVKFNVQLHRDIATRAGNVNKDEDFLNCIFEIVKDKSIDDTRRFILKRAGTGQGVASQGAGTIRGMIFWEDQNKLLYSFNKHVVVYNFNTSTATTLSNVFSTTTGEVGFTEYLYDTNAVVICATDGTTLIQIDTSNAVTTCVDADLPTPHKPYPVFVDGYLLLVKSGTADLYNSDLNDPMAWTPGNFISAEIQPDLLVRIGKSNNYVLALGTESIEYFWDAANSTGSPFSRNDSPIKLNTYLAGYAQLGNTVIYTGKNVAGEPSVFIVKDFKLDEVGTPTVSRYLNFVTTDPSTWLGTIISVQGHSIYLLNTGSLTLAYDIDSKLWGKWAYQQSGYFPISYASRVSNATLRRTYFSMTGSTSEVYYFDDALGTDNGTNYTTRIITEQSNFGSLNRKTMPKLSIFGDRTPANSNIIVYWTDDDYQNWSGPATINLNQDLQSAYKLGSFRQRAFKLEYTDQYIFRIQSLEVTINKGTS